MTNKPGPLDGGGPWRVLPECEATRHNTVRAADGRNTEIRCICPRALDVFRERADKRNRVRKREGRPPRAEKQSGIVKVEQRAPDLSTGTCTKPRFREVMDDAIGTVLESKLQVARDVCSYCPVEQACKTWVIGQEKPAGSWGGVWGGLSVRERRNMARVPA